MVKTTMIAAPYAVVGGLVAAEDILGPSRQWDAKNERQARFLFDFFRMLRGEVTLIPELERFASFDYRAIVEWVEKRNFPCKLSPFAADTFGAVSYMNILTLWFRPGVKGEITSAVTGHEFTGARLKDSQVFHLRALRHADVISGIRSETGTVYMTMFDPETENPLDLIGATKDLMRAARVDSGFGGLRYPMVSLEKPVDISWLVGMTTEGEDGTPVDIAEAIQLARFKLNEKGARFETSVQLGMKVMHCAVEHKPDHVINKPFLVWCEREGLSQPLYAMYIAEEDWKDPGDL